jgi:integrase/recombinase XerC
VGINNTDLSSDNTSLKVRGKGGKERTLPILRQISDYIFDYQVEIYASKICIKDKKALILSLKGERLSASSVYNIVRNELARMGVKGKLSPHVLRHTFATHLMNRGGDMRTLQELMGHASLRSTQVYTHNTIATMRAAYDRAHPRGAQTAISGANGTQSVGEKVAGEQSVGDKAVEERTDKS